MGEAIITRGNDINKSYVDTLFTNSMDVNTDEIDHQTTVVTGGTPYEFCSVNFPAGYKGIVIVTAVVTANQGADAKIYLGYGIGNDSDTIYLQTENVLADNSDHYMNASFYISSSNSSRTIHGAVGTFAGQSFEFNRGDVQLILFRDYGINSLVNGDEVSY